MGVGGQSHVPATLLPPLPGNDPVLIVMEAGWGPGPVWTGAENLAPTETRSPDRPAHSESLYLLSYPGQFCRTESFSYIVDSHKALQSIKLNVVLSTTEFMMCRTVQYVRVVLKAEADGKWQKGVSAYFKVSH